MLYTQPKERQAERSNLIISLEEVFLSAQGNLVFKKIKFLGVYCKINLKAIRFAT